jgi:hypothetical protein
VRVHSKPILTIDKAWLADSDRVVRGRLPGAFKKLRNLTSALSDGIGRVRTGYESYSSGKGGYDPPASMDNLDILPVQNPEETDIHIYYANSGVYMYPHYSSAGRTQGTFDGTLQKSFTGAAGSVAAFAITFTGADALTLSKVNDYYNNWIIENDTNGEYAFITDYAYSSAASGTATFTVQSVVISTEIFWDWAVTDAYKLYIHFLKLNESKAITATWEKSTADNKIRWTGSEALGFSNTNDHYNGWLCRNVTKDEYSIVIDYAYYQGTYATFTLLDDVIDFDGATAVGLDWAVTDDITFYRSFHGAPTTAVTYNNTLTDPPTANVENSIIRLSGGQGTDAGLRSVMIFPKLTRTFLPGNARQLAYASTYVEARECGDLSKAVLTSSAVVGVTAAKTSLPTGKTYWVGIAPVYDFYQLGKLRKWESVAGDYAPTSGDWVDNYVASSATANVLDLPLSISLATWNKRITGLAIYLAQDSGDTSATGRVNPYHFIKHISLVDSTDPYLSAWSYGATTGLHTQTFTIDGDMWNSKGGTYFQDSGYLDTDVYTGASYSTEAMASGRRYIANFCPYSTFGTDRDSVITNPTGGNPVFNSGVIQPDIFPYEDGVFRIRVDQTVGTKINAVVPMGADSFIVLKDRGLIDCRVIIVDNVPVLIQSVESRDVGCTSVNGWAKDDSGTVFFPSLEDIYSYKNGVLNALIERPDHNDWLTTYRNISPTNKAGAVLTYLPELKSILFIFGGQLTSSFNDLQYLLDQGGWRSIYFNVSSGSATTSFKHFTSLTNGHIVGITSAASGSAVPHRMTWSYTDGVYTFGYYDNGTGIIPYFDTGDFFFDPTLEYVLSEVVINRTLTSSTTTGALDIDVKIGDDVSFTQAGFTSVPGTYRLRMRPDPADIRRGNRFQMIYNTNGTPNRLNTGNVYQIDSIELHGRIAPRRQAITE